MDRTTFRILDTLSRDLGSHVSINELTKRISRLHGPAYYKNIYDKVQKLSRKRLLRTTTVGNTCQVCLNFDSYELSSLLGEMEYEKKRALISSGNWLLSLISSLDEQFRPFPISSISIIRPLKAASLNRAELLFILPDPRPFEIDGKPGSTETVKERNLRERIAIHSAIRGLERHHNTRLDPLILNKSEFFSLLRPRDPTLRDMLSDQATFFRPEDFWITVKEAKWKGTEFGGARVTPNKISEGDIAYNLERFGYREFGKGGKGRDIPLEYVITSVLLSGDARRTEAIPVLLAKNKPNYSLLLFLCQKHSRLEKLLGLLNALKKIKCSNDALSAIRIIEALGIREEKADLRDIKKKMELYHAA